MRSVLGNYRMHPLILVLLVGFLYASYFVLRYGGLWIENDTAVFSQVTSQWIQSGQVATSAYYHGFAYQAWLANLSLLTGIDVNGANTLVAPFLGVVMVIVPAYLCYSALLKNDKRATIAVLMLFTIPELMFTVLRGNHEKLNICFFLMGLFSLLKSFESADEAKYKGVIFWTVFYYVLVFFNTSVNDYFAATIVSANIPAIFILYFLTRKAPQLQTARKLLPKLGFSVLTCFLIVLLVMMFIFPEAGQDFVLVKTSEQQVQDLFTSMHASSNPYTAVAQAWAGQFVSSLMSSFRKTLLALSFLSFVVQFMKYKRNKVAVSLQPAFLIALYGSFGMIIAISIPVDFSGLAAGNNLEVRNYTYFAVIASPMIASVYFSDFIHRKLKLIPIIAARLCGFALASFLILGLLKTTLDPVVSNNWIFYSSGEYQALRDYFTFAKDATLWTGADNRLIPLAEVMSSIYPTNNDQVAGFYIDNRPQISDILWSTQIQSQLMAQQMVGPNVQIQNRIYDNGSAQIYQKPANTIFQYLNYD